MLTQIAYKVYTSMLAERLREEVKEKNLLPPNQTRFRRGDIGEYICIESFN